MRNHSVRRTAALASVVLAASVVTAQAPAFAAAKATSHVKATATPVTVRVGGTIAVTGSVSPKSVASVVLQRLVGKSWTTVGHAKASRTGVFALNLHAPSKAGALVLRVTRAATATSKPSIGATLHVRVVKTAFSLTTTHSASPLTTAQPLVVAGKVSPRGKGGVSLDRLVGSRWVSIAKATLTSASAYSFSRTLAAGSYKLRVSKPFTTTVAAGIGKSFTEVVTTPVTTPPPSPPAIVLPVVSTTTLAGVTVGAAFHQTLTATSGTAPYSWSVASGTLPTGLSLLPSGDVFGTPTSVATFSFTVRATDSLGHSGTGSITAVVHPVGVRSWGYGIDGEYGDNTTASTFSIATASLPGTTTKVAVGNHYALALQADGTVYAWGVNDSGQLGLGDKVTRPVPTLITTINNITAIGAGEDAAYAVSSAGVLYSWGSNAVGQLGTGVTSTTPTLVPTAITLANVVSVAAGDAFALALTGNGAVFGWGDGQHGVIGDGNNTPQVVTPTRASALSVPDHVFVSALSATSTASYALLSDGTVMSWGLKEHGQLGNANLTGAGLTQPTPAPVTGLTGVTSLSCTGFEFCLALRSDRTVFAWGDSVFGALGNGQSTTDSPTAAAVPGLTDITAIATARSTGYALHANGTVSSWGLDDSNQLGNGDQLTNNISSPAPIPGLSGVVGVAAGGTNGYALQAR